MRAERGFVILSAGMGAGHDAVAGELARRLRGRGHAARCVDLLDLLPPGTGAALRHGYSGAVRHAPWLYEAVYGLLFTGRPTVAAADGSPVVAAAASALRRRLALWRPDAVVSTFHQAARVGGRLRRLGELRVPNIVLVTDFAVHRQWLHPATDLYLCPGPAAAARASDGTGRPARAVGPVVPGAFFDPPDPAAHAAWVREFARRAPGRDPVLVSTGAWGVGSQLERTAHVLHRGGYLPVVLCGRDAGLRRRLARRPETLALGWVTDMPALLSSVRVLLDNAAGQTAVQALAAGLPVVGYRPIAGHGREGVRQMAAAGLARHARDPWELLRALGALAPPGTEREAAVAAGRAAFTGDAAAAVVDAARGTAADPPG